MERQDLRKAGLKATTPRLRILEALREGAPQHVSAEDLYRRLTAAGEPVFGVLGDPAVLVYERFGR